MARATAGDIELEYESMGDGEPLVLIMGIGAQLVWWPDELCQGLVQRGFRVIRFDNREVGLSTRLDHLPVPPVKRALVDFFLGRPVSAPYSLLDMADDVAGLLDHLGLADAHVFGVSLGGMVAQTLAIVHPSRVRSLISMMSSPGGRRHSIARPRAAATLLRKPPRNEEEAIENHLEFLRTCGSPGFEIDEAAARERAALSYRRSVYPPGFARQMAAVLATGDRTGALRFVRKPSLVIHGAADPLILPSAGRATARAIPNADLLMIDGLGHDLPEGVWPTLIDAIGRHALG